ncbi:unnamed protein product [Mucor hiemalis]
MPLTKPPTPPPKPEFDEPSTPKDFNKKFKEKPLTKYMNPCAVEEKQSMKCLMRTITTKELAIFTLCNIKNVKRNGWKTDATFVEQVNFKFTLVASQGLFEFQIK